MCNSMPTQLGRGSKCFCAMWATMGSLPCMYVGMSLQRNGGWKTFFTLLTFIWFFTLNEKYFLVIVIDWIRTNKILSSEKLSQISRICLCECSSRESFKINHSWKFISRNFALIFNWTFCWFFTWKIPSLYENCPKLLQKKFAKVYLEKFSGFSKFLSTRKFFQFK